MDRIKKTPNKARNNLLFRTALFSERRRSTVTLVILSKDKYHLLQECITAIFDKIHYPNCSIVIGDMGSTNREMLNYYTKLEQEISPLPVKVIYDLTPNISRNYNILIENHCHSDYIITLSHNIVAINDFVSNMMLYATNNVIGAVGAKITFKENKIWHMGQVLFREEGELLNPDEGPYHYHFREKKEDYELPDMMVESVSLSCMLFPKNVFMWIGKFDEDLKEAYQDTDFSLTLKEYGFSVVQCNGAKLFYGEDSSIVFTPTQRDRWREECIFYYRKWIKRAPLANKTCGKATANIFYNCCEIDELPNILEKIPSKYGEFLFSTIAIEALIFPLFRVTTQSKIIDSHKISTFLLEIKDPQKALKHLNTMKVIAFSLENNGSEALDYHIKWHCNSCNATNESLKLGTLLPPSLHQCVKCNTTNQYLFELVPPPQKRNLHAISQKLYDLPHQQKESIEYRLGRGWQFLMNSHITNLLLREE